jgi:hypothetical protein
MEYVCLEWDPVAQRNIYALEMVQRIPSRFTVGDYRATGSVTNMLQEFNWTTSEKRRKRVNVIMLYQIICLTTVIPNQPMQPYFIPRRT